MPMADRDPVPQFLIESNWADFFHGFSLPFWALGMIFRSKKLLALSLVAALVSIVVLIAVAFFVLRYTGHVVHLLGVRHPPHWYGRGGYYLVTGFTFVVLLVVGANTLPLLFLAPLQDPISEATEEACGDFAPPRFSLHGFLRNSAVAFAHTLARISFLAVGHLLLLSLHFLPLVGSLLWAVAANAWTAGWLAAEYLDAPMARHLYPFREVQGVIGDRFRLCLGFGVAVYFILWIPVVNVFLIPLAIVGGTLLYRGLRASGNLGLPPKASQSLHS
jgi:CysZ protein